MSTLNVAGKTCTYIAAVEGIKADAGMKLLRYALERVYHRDIMVLLANEADQAFNSISAMEHIYIYKNNILIDRKTYIHHFISVMIK